MLSGHVQMKACARSTLISNEMSSSAHYYCSSMRQLVISKSRARKDFPVSIQRTHNQREHVGVNQKLNVSARHMPAKVPARREK